MILDKAARLFKGFMSTFIRKFPLLCLSWSIIVPWKLQNRFLCCKASSENKDAKTQQTFQVELTGKSFLINCCNLITFRFTKTNLLPAGPEKPKTSAVLTLIRPMCWVRLCSVVSVHWQSKYQDFSDFVLLHFPVNNKLGDHFCRLLYLLAAALASALVYWAGGHCSSAEEEKICVHQHQLHFK